MSDDPLKARAKVVLEQLREARAECSGPGLTERDDALGLVLEGAILLVEDLVELFGRVERMAILLDSLMVSGGEIGKAARYLAKQLELSLEVFDPLKQDLILQAGNKIWQVRTVDVKTVVRHRPDVAEFTIEMRGTPASADAVPGIVDRPVEITSETPVSQVDLSSFAARLRGAFAGGAATPSMPIAEHMTRSDLCQWGYGDPPTSGCARARTPGASFCPEHVEPAYAGRCHADARTYAGHQIQWRAGWIFCSRCKLEFGANAPASCPVHAHTTRGEVKTIGLVVGQQPDVGTEERYANWSRQDGAVCCCGRLTPARRAELVEWNRQQAHNLEGFGAGRGDLVRADYFRAEADRLTRFGVRP